MGKVFFILVLLLGVKSQAMLTTCITYDVENSHPDDIRVSLFIKCMRKGPVLYVDGGIDPYLIDELRVFNEEPITTVYLNSGGGLVEDAIELAEFIRDNGITTIVRKNALCASACTLLFQAGVRRVAHPKARFMYHSARNLMIGLDKQQQIQSCLESPNDLCMAEIEEKRQDLLDTTEGMFDLYEKWEASPKLREDYFSQPKQEAWWESGNYVGLLDWWLMAPSLRQYNVVTELLER